MKKNANEKIMMLQYRILMDWGKYKSSVNKIDVYTGDVKLARI